VATLSVKATDLAAALRSGNDEIARAVVRGVAMGAHRARAVMVKATPVDQGQLKAGWYVFLGWQGVGKTKIPAIGAMLAELGNSAPHIGIVELGARPHKTNAEGWAAIYEWARRHFGYTPAGGGRMRRIGGDTGEDPFLSAITWGIVKRLEREGQKPTFFVRDNLPTLRRLMGEEISRSIAHAAATLKPPVGRNSAGRYTKGGS